MEIPHTCGPSVVSVIKNCARRCLTIYDYAQAAYLTDAQLNSFDAVVGCVGGAFMRRIITPKPILFLRNPVDRMHSIYSYRKNENEQVKKDSTLDLTFPEWLISLSHECAFEVSGEMAWQLAVDRSPALKREHAAITRDQLFHAACATIDKSFFLGVNDNITEDLRRMCFKLDFDPPENLESLYYPRSALTLTDTERRCAESILEIDMELFYFAKSVNY